MFFNRFNVDEDSSEKFKNRTFKNFKLGKGKIELPSEVSPPSSEELENFTLGFIWNKSLEYEGEQFFSSYQKLLKELDFEKAGIYSDSVQIALTVDENLRYNKKKEYSYNGFGGLLELVFSLTGRFIYEDANNTLLTPSFIKKVALFLTDLISEKTGSKPHLTRLKKLVSTTNDVFPAIQS